MRVSLVVAVAENGVIGKDNELPWRLSGDLKMFKALTMGKPLIMGRRTFESIGRPLPGRTSIVLTRDASFEAEGIVIAGDRDGALRLAEQACARTGADEAMVIGGADIFDLFMGAADRLYLTEVHMAPDGDTFFPAVDPAEWREVSRERHAAREGESSDYSFVVLDRADR